MQLTRPIWRKQADLLAADTTSLGSVTAMHVHLAKALFTPSLDLTLGDVVEATFTGSTAKNAGTGTQPVYYDAVTGALTLRVLEPTGGWSWICTVDPMVTETIHGYYLTDNTDAVLYGSALLPVAAPIAHAGDGVSIGEIVMSWLTNSPY